MAPTCRLAPAQQLRASDRRRFCYQMSPRSAAAAAAAAQKEGAGAIKLCPQTGGETRAAAADCGFPGISREVALREEGRSAESAALPPRQRATTKARVPFARSSGGRRSAREHVVSCHLATHPRATFGDTFLSFM